MSGRISNTRASFADLMAEGREVWTQFERISVAIPGCDDLKAARSFIWLQGAEEGTNLYTYLPFLFEETFPELNKDQIRQLSLFGLLYLYHILLADKVMDEEQMPRTLGVSVSNTYYLRALETLAGLYGDKAMPWARILEYHHQYTTAILLEAERGNGLNRYELADVFSILSRKSAMAKMVPVVMCGLSGREEYLESLIRSFDLYYLSDGLCDDFRDWKKDLGARRYSYLLTEVITRCNIQHQVQEASPEEAVELVGKHFYLSGIAEFYLAKVIEHWEQAKQQVAGIHCPRWIRLLDSLQLGIAVRRSAIAQQARKVLLQPNAYEYRLIKQDDYGMNEWEARTHPVTCVANSVLDAGRRAADFLWTNRQTGPCFADFLVAGQPLSTLVSAYVGAALLDWKGLCGNPGASTGASNEISRDVQLELAARQTSFGWAANHSAPADSHTTAWVLTFLMRQKAIVREALSLGVEALLKYRRSDGGFAAYLPDSVEGDFSGYCESHVEVTAVVLQALIQAGVDVDDEVVQRAVGYISDQRQPNGLWQAYWWDSRMYATYHCVRALGLAGGNLEPAARDRLISRILMSQSPDGSFGENTAGKNKPFETALAVRCLLLLDRCRDGDSAVERSIIWLINYQNRDGALLSEPIMRIPHGADKTPWLRTSWKFDAPNEVGVIVRDQNNLFTTSTVLAALADFIARIGNRSLVTTVKQNATVGAG